MQAPALRPTQWTFGRARNSMNPMPRYLCLAAVLSILGTSAFCGEVWLFLKDGKVCRADAGNTNFATLADGSRISVADADIQGQRTHEQADLTIDAMLAEIMRGKNFEAHGARFKAVTWRTCISEFIAAHTPAAGIGCAAT
jgi:hypothetical protein